MEGNPRSPTNEKKEREEGSSPKKILYIMGALDLDTPFGAVPAQWQILKALYEVGIDVIAVPYFGASIRGLWWRCYKNPCSLESSIYGYLGQISSRIKSTRARTYKSRMTEFLIPEITKRIINPQWKKFLFKVINLEKNVDLVMFAGVPLNHFVGIPSFIRRRFGIPVIFYDMDIPTSLPKYGGFSFNYYVHADPSEYDAFVIPSEGSEKELFEMGARKVHIMHFAVDPDIYFPFKTKKSIDVFFYGTGTEDREHLVEMMISIPSKVLSARFVISSSRIGSNVGNAITIQQLPFSLWRRYCWRSKINLNITRMKHSECYGTSTSRPFELAALGCCVISGPHKGLEKWFRLGKEMFMVNTNEEAIELYSWLLNDSETLRKVGAQARERVLREHTVKHRIQNLFKFLATI